MRKTSRFFLIAGCLLILGSLGLLATSRIRAEWARTYSAEVVSCIESIIPERTAGDMDAYLSMEMPVLQIDGQDFVGIVEIPSFGLALPIYSSWDAGKVTSFPCRFWGTVYDGSLVVGGADQAGQFDCFDRIQDGSTVTVTDMTGGESVSTVARVDRSKSAQADVLMDYSMDLTLFVRDAYNLNYILVRCMMKGRANG